MDIKKIIAKKESKKRLYDFPKKVMKKLIKEDESFLVVQLVHLLNLLRIDIE